MNDERSSFPVAILAGGLATRLLPLTGKIPKSLVPVAGRPFLQHQIELLRAAGLTRIVICAGHLGEMIRDAFGNGSAHGVHMDYSFDGDPLLGTGGALWKALPLLGDFFFVLYGDSYLPIDYQAVARAFLESKKEGLMTVFRNEERWDASNVWFEDGVIKSYDKRRRHPSMRHIDYGLSIFAASAIARLPADAAVDLSEVFADLLARNQLAGYEVSQRFYEIGSHSGLAELDDVLSRNAPDISTR